MRVLDAAAVASALPFAPLIAALRERFAAGCEVPPRHVHQIRGADGQVLTSLLMPAWTRDARGGGHDGGQDGGHYGGHYGVKIINIAPGNAALGLPALHASYLLHDARSGAPLALLDGSELTARRTAAASALAASWLARADAAHLLVVGAGRVAAMLPLAYREVRRLDRVSVWARRSEAAQQLADRLCQQGLNAHRAIDLDAAVASADMVACATLATTPLLRGRLLDAGSHLDLIGSFTPDMREADDDALRGAAVYVDTEEAWAKSGELLAPLASGALQREAIRGTLAMLARGEVEGRRSRDERTVFKSVGTALEDLAAAMLAAAPRTVSRR